MSQIDNFRKSLGLPNPEEAAGNEVKGKTMPGVSKKRTSRTVALREDTFLRLRAIIFWMMREERMPRATIDDIVNLGLDALLENEPGLHSYIKVVSSDKTDTMIV